MVQENKKKFNVENLYFFIYTLYFFYYIICISSNFSIKLGNTFIRLLQYSIYLGFLTKIVIFDKHNKEEWLMFFSLMVLTLTIYYFNKDIRFFEMILLIISSKNIEIEKIAKRTIYLIAIFTFIVIISSFLNIIPNYIFYRDDTGESRESLGFTYVAQLPLLVLEAIFAVLFTLKDRKDNIFIMIFLVILSIIVYRITDVRNIFVCSIILILFYLINKYTDVFSIKVVQIMVTLLYVICLVLSLWCISKYDPNDIFWRKIDTTLNTRLSISYKMVNLYDIRAMGNKFDMYGVSAIKNSKKLTGEDYSYIDNLYLQILLKDGIIISIIIMIIYTKLLYNCMKSSRYRLIGIWLGIITISSLIADGAILVVYNFPILLFMEILKREKTNEEETN